MRTNPASLLGLCLLALAIGACTGPPPGQGPMGGPMSDEETCDPAACDEFCGNAGCLFPADPDGSICRRHCAENWCNAFFDDVDEEVMACSRRIGFDITCEETLQCCHEYFTAEICPSESEGGWSGEQ